VSIALNGSLSGFWGFLHKRFPHTPYRPDVFRIELSKLEPKGTKKSFTLEDLVKISDEKNIEIMEGQDRERLEKAQACFRM